MLEGQEIQRRDAENGGLPRNELQSRFDQLHLLEKELGLQEPKRCG